MGSNSIIDAQVELAEQAKIGRKISMDTIKEKIRNQKNLDAMIGPWNDYWSQVWRTSELGQGEAKDSLATFPGRLPWSY